MQSMQLSSLPRSGGKERNREQRRTKVNFGRAMMRVLELQRLAKRHISLNNEKFIC